MQGMLHDRTEQLKVIDLFAGAGGFSCGFEQTGCFKVILAVEKDPQCRLTYKSNHTDDVRVLDDILRVIQDDQLRNLAEEITKSHGGVDVIIGGPPCQGFSKANRQRNHLVSTNNMLVTAYVKCVAKLNPRAFVMENVADMPKHNFFVSSDPADQEALAFSEVALVNEEPVLGQAEGHAELMVAFLREHLTENGVVTAPECAQLVGEVYPVLRVTANYLLRRRHDKVIRYLRKKSSFLARALKRVTSAPCGLPQDFRSDLIGALQALSSFDGGSGTVDDGVLVSVVNWVGILARMNELAQNRIKVTEFFATSDRAVCARLQSYNLADHLEAYFRRQGYVVRRQVLEATHFGVPQRRERVFFIGVREDTGVEAVLFPVPITHHAPYTVKDAIFDLAKYPPFFDVRPRTVAVVPDDSERPPLAKLLHGGIGHIPNHVQTTTTETALSRYRALQQGQNFHSLPQELKASYSDPGRTQRNIYRRLAYDAPALTVTNVRKAMWVHPELDRAISIREAARLQSFPDRYEFHGRKNDQYQQVGNAVPPLLARAVGEIVANMLGQRPTQTLFEELAGHPPLGINEEAAALGDSTSRASITEQTGLD